MKIIFETSLDGHRYEYLHNLYIYAGKHNKGEVIFVLPDDERLKKWTKEKFSNVNIVLLTENDLELCTNPNLLIASYYKSKILNKYVKKYSATSVFLIFLMLYMPFLIFSLPKRTKVSGIVYRSFLWEDVLKKNLLRKSLEWLRYWIMAKNSKVEKVFLLNDDRSAKIFNDKFFTKKFERLPDPYTPIEGIAENIKEKIKISIECNLFVQIGQLSSRKGTLEILEAIAMLTNEEKQKNAFFFAGKIADDIKKTFYEKFYELKKKGVRLYVKDEFVSFGFLNSLCASCDCMLTPYKNTSQSSGAIGYAAQYGKPVIGPSKGLLGYLINHYRLGYEIKNVSSLEIYRAISTFKRIPVPDDYVKENQLSDFLKLCLD